MSFNLDFSHWLYKYQYSNYNVLFELQLPGEPIEAQKMARLPQTDFDLRFLSFFHRFFTLYVCLHFKQFQHFKCS